VLTGASQFGTWTRGNPDNVRSRLGRSTEESARRLGLWVGGAPRSRSCDELEALITQHLRIATAILYVALAGELAAMGLL